MSRCKYRCPVYAEGRCWYECNEQDCHHMCEESPGSCSNDALGNYEDDE